MKKEKYRGWNCIFNEKADFEFIDAVLNKNYEDIKILKDDKRSLVKLIKINSIEYVLKIPREKNNRKWQRFVNIFRGSDSFRNFYMMKKLKEIGIKSTEGVIALEKRTPLVVDSILVMKFLEGEEVKENDYRKVVEAIDLIHSKGYLHGDSQIQNFMIKNGEVYSIDLRLQKNIYGSIGRMYEFIYLRESCPQIDFLYNDIKNKLGFKIAWLWKKWLYIHGDIRKFVKGKK